MNLLIPIMDIPYKVNTNNKRYFFEICLLTKSRNENELDAWLSWHFNKVNVDHIHIYDNESTVNMLNVLKKYGNRVSYTRVNGTPHQADIYTQHVREISEAQYVLPLDDDEFIISSIDIKAYLKRVTPVKLSIGSLLFVPEHEMAEPNDHIYLETNTHLVNGKLRENREVKTIVNTSYSHFYYDVKRYEDNHPNPIYENCSEYYVWQISDDTDDYEIVRGQKNQFNVIGNVHNPLTYTKDNYLIHSQDIFMRNVYGYMTDYTNVPCELFIAHMKIRSRAEWDWKCNVRKVVADMSSNYYDTQYSLFDEIYTEKKYDLQFYDLMK